MTTYIFTQDSILRAFEGPEEPQQSGDSELTDTRLEAWQKQMSTARESSLPVVNADLIAMSRGIPQQKVFAVNGDRLPNVTDGEPVALPGWGLEKVNEFWNVNEWQQLTCEVDVFKKSLPKASTREAYRLVRLEPEKKEPIKLTFYSGKLWHSDKPFPEHMVGDQSKKPVPGARKWNKQAEEQKQWLSTAYEVTNPEVIPDITRDVNTLLIYELIDISRRKLIDGDQITLPEGYGIRIEYQVKDLNVIDGWLPISKELYIYDRDVVRPENKAEKRIIAAITLPEKPNKDKYEVWFNGQWNDVCESKYLSFVNNNHYGRINGVLQHGDPEKPDNSAHGDTEPLTLQKAKQIVAEKHGSKSWHDFNIWNRGNDLCDEVAELYKNSHVDPWIKEAVDRQKKLNEMVEPSESQEEMMGNKSDKYSQDYMLEEIIDMYIDWDHDDKDPFSALLTQLKEKFTITRK